MREGLWKCLSQKAHSGITPARAGRTFIHEKSLRLTEDHPRSHGKDPNSSLSVIKAIGSPPLAREGRQIISRVRILRRITPACAGRTKSSLPYAIRIAGSPPRVREGLSHFRNDIICRRITPAGAGRTSVI